MSSLSIYDNKAINKNYEFYNDLLNSSKVLSKDIGEKFNNLLFNSVEKLVRPLIENIMKSAQADTLDPTQSLQAEIDQKNNPGILKIPPGNYGVINVNKNLRLTAADSNNPPHIQRINAINVSRFYVDNITIGNPNLSAGAVKNLPESEIGIRVVIKDDENVDIGINNSRILGVADGISISSPHPTKNTENQRITINGNTISNIQRDGINLKNVGQYAITRNTIHSIHPNYEDTNYTNLRKASNAPDAAVVLPNGVMAQHADGIQATNAKGGVISGNKLSIGNGTWYQAINVHHEADSPYRHLATEPVRIQNNTIQNNHDFAISVKHFNISNASANNNNIRAQAVDKRKELSTMSVLKETLQ